LEKRTDPAVDAHQDDVTSLFPGLLPCTLLDERFDNLTLLKMGFDYLKSWPTFIHSDDPTYYSHKCQLKQLDNEKNVKLSKFPARSAQARQYGNIYFFLRREDGGDSRRTKNIFLSSPSQK
jgi:hypothetical protein